MNKRWIPIVAVILVASIFLGEILTYSSGLNRYDSSAERNGTIVDYSVSSSGTNDYSAILIDNHGFERLDRLVIYVDEDYGANFNKATSLTAVCYMDPTYYAEQIERSMKIRSFENVTVCGRQGLIDYLEETKADPKGCGILSPSYALPGEIYRGNSDDTLMKWIGAGGSIYWVGSVPGALYYDNGELTQVGGCQSLFFGSDCIVADWNILPDNVGGTFTKELCLIGYEVFLGVDTSKLPAGKQFRAMGCMKDSLAAYTLVQYGEGMVVQSAGKFRIEQFEDFAQIMASGICYKSDIAGYEEGRVTRNTVHDSFDSTDGDVLYIFIGRAYSVYGRTYDV